MTTYQIVDAESGAVALELGEITESIARDELYKLRNLYPEYELNLEKVES